MSEMELSKAVAEEIAQTLSLEVDEVTPASNLFADLGAESIDILDLSFRCEKRFGIKMEISKMLSPDDLAADETGRLTPACSAGIKARFPSLDVDAIRPAEGIASVKQVLTAAVVTDYVRLKLQAAAG